MERVDEDEGKDGGVQDGREMRIIPTLSGNGMKSI